MVVMAVVVMQPNFLPQYLLVHASVKSNIKEAVIMMSEEKVVLLQLPCSLPSVTGQEEFQCVLCLDELFFNVCCLLLCDQSGTVEKCKELAVPVPSAW